MSDPDVFLEAVKGVKHTADCLDDMSHLRRCTCDWQERVASGLVAAIDVAAGGVGFIAETLRAMVRPPTASTAGFTVDESGNMDIGASHASHVTPTTFEKGSALPPEEKK